jgi:hypothetical protein
MPDLRLYVRPTESRIISRNGNRIGRSVTYEDARFGGAASALGCHRWEGFAILHTKRRVLGNVKLRQGWRHGGAIALALGLFAFLFGLPWNIVLAVAWGMIAKAPDHPAWLGDTRNEWAGLAMVLIMSVVGTFITARSLAGPLHADGLGGDI